LYTYGSCYVLGKIFGLEANYYVAEAEYQEGEGEEEEEDSPQQEQVNTSGHCSNCK